MIYILFILFNGALTTHSVEFQTEIACEEARKEITGISTFCVKSGIDPNEVVAKPPLDFGHFGKTE